MKMNVEQEFKLAETPLTNEQLEKFKPIEQVLPTEQLNMLLTHTEARNKVRGKQKAPTKQAISLRLSPEVITAFKATGKGWQSRINDVLLQAIKTL